MLHPEFARALATAHIDDLHRAAARRRTIRFAREVAHERAAIGVDSATWTQGASGRRHDTNRDSTSGNLRSSVT
jgi:hypothetical protein